jgi:hypothetical protein
MRFSAIFRVLPRPKKRINPKSCAQLQTALPEVLTAILEGRSSQRGRALRLLNTENSRPHAIFRVLPRFSAAKKRINAKSCAQLQTALPEVLTAIVEGRSSQRGQALRLLNTEN